MVRNVVIQLEINSLLHSTGTGILIVEFLVRKNPSSLDEKETGRFRVCLLSFGSNSSEETRNCFVKDVAMSLYVIAHKYFWVSQLWAFMCSL